MRTPGRRSVFVTANFERNLASIHDFLREQEAEQAFDELLDRLFATVIPNIETFPAIGVDFLERRPQSSEGIARWTALKRRLGNDVALREYISGDYLVLYAVRQDAMFLLAIKHHRQLSFDLRTHWV